MADAPKLVMASRGLSGLLESVGGGLIALVDNGLASSMWNVLLCGAYAASGRILPFCVLDFRASGGTQVEEEMFENTVLLNVCALQTLLRFPGCISTMHECREAWSADAWGCLKHRQCKMRPTLLQDEEPCLADPPDKNC